MGFGYHDLQVAALICPGLRIIGYSWQFFVEKSRLKINGIELMVLTKQRTMI